MNKSESAKCFNEQIRKRWPHWTPNDVEIADWLCWLGDYDYHAVAAAARRHLAESRYAKPIPSQLFAYASKAISTPSPPAKKTSAFPEPHTFIMCTGKDDRGKGAVGAFWDIILWPLDRTWTAADTHRVATDQARKRQATCGGVWEVFTQTNHLEMLRRSNALCGIQPLDLTRLRKGNMLKS